MRRAIFVGRFAAAFPAKIVVENHDAARREKRVKILETYLRGLVPIAVESQDSDWPQPSNVPGNRILEPPDMKLNLLLGKAELFEQQTANFGKARFTFVD